jgi:hypothetical protein
MKWPVIVLMVMTVFLWITTLMLLVMGFLVRRGKLMGELYSYLDASKLERTRKRSMWLAVPIVVMAAAGVILPVLKPGILWLLAGIVIVSAAFSGGAALFFLAQIARNAKMESTES